MYHLIDWMESKINIGTLGTSSASLVASLIHANSITSLAEEVEDLKSSLSTIDIESINLFGGADDELTNIDITPPTVDPSLTPVGQLEDAVKQVDAFVTQVLDVPRQITFLIEQVQQEEDKIQVLDTQIGDSRGKIKSLLDVSTDIKGIFGEYNTLSTKTHISDNGQFNGKDCNIGLLGNRGDISALHFLGLSNNKWAMYMANPSGNGPSITSPPSHADVTGDAIRMRIGDGSGDGIIVENPEHGSVFSISSTGNMSAGPAVFGDIDSETSGFAHTGNLKSADFALSQSSDGTTRANAKSGQELQLCIGGEPKVWIDPRGSMVLKNQLGTANTVFNHLGNNIIVSKPGSTTDFKIGNDIIMHTGIETEIEKSLSINGADLVTELNTIAIRMSVMDGRSVNVESEDIPAVSETIISTSEAPPSVPRFIQRGNKVSFHNVDANARKRYLDADNSAPHDVSSSSSSVGRGVEFFIETTDYSLHLETNKKVALKSARDHGNYIKWISSTSFKVTGTDDSENSAHFLLRGDRLRIRDGDEVTLYSYGGGGFLNTEGDGVTKTLSSVGGSLTSTKSKYIISIR